ncbi:MAG: PEP/pyruvate-binding domain-containing protein [Pseudomonadota bacterium]
MSRNLSWFKQRKKRSLSSADALRFRYKGFRDLLAKNSEMLEKMADLEADLSTGAPEEYRIRQPVIQLLSGALLLAEDLNILTGDQFRPLYNAYQDIENDVLIHFRSIALRPSQPLIIPTNEVNIKKTDEVGGKAANLGELCGVISEAIPRGFVITTAAYRLFLARNNLHGRIRALLKNLDAIADRELFKERTAEIRALIESALVPSEIEEAINQGVSLFSPPHPWKWAVRSSGVGEDGSFTFAGQFESLLNVEKENVLSAYQKVVASCYSNRAVIYRIMRGYSEVGTPMAVLFLPMINASRAGVLYTRDPQDGSADRMLINAVRGLGEGLVRGEAEADFFVVSRSGKVLEERITEKSDYPKDKEEKAPTLTPEQIEALANYGLRIEKYFGVPQDIEWVIDYEDKVSIVQSRQLRVENRVPLTLHSPVDSLPLISGGTTIVPGRIVGPAHVVHSLRELDYVPEGVLLVVRQATPDLSTVLPFLSGLIAEYGNPAGHAATLVREFNIPCIFGMKGATEKIEEGKTIGIDATYRKVFLGNPWPEMQSRVQKRELESRSESHLSLLHERIIKLNLTDPMSANFRAKKCWSIHDIVRFTHEKAVAAMFSLGDKEARRMRYNAKQLLSAIPLNFYILDIGGSLKEEYAEKNEVPPQEVNSIPFQALWRGIVHPHVSWSGRTTVSISGFLSVMSASMNDPRASIRRLGEYNYIIVAPDYINLNARLAYHFTMIDALVSDTPEYNYVNFRFRGGGAQADRRNLRARFLAEVLLRSNFRVDRRGDLVTAWMRRYTRKASEDGLTLLAKLMGCARQLDMLMNNEQAMHHFINRFLEGDYQAFA